MRVSIITVCYNSSSTILKTLLSVRAQCYENIEHIIIDGNSTDGTLDIIYKSGCHISKLISEKDLGIYDAMNKGVNLASGEIIGFLNSDDYYKDSTAISVICDAMLKEGLDVVFGDVEFFSPRDENLVIRRYNSAIFTPKRIAYGIAPAHPAFFVKKDIFNRAGLFKINYAIAGDFEFIARVFALENLRYLHIPRALVRMQMGGISTSGFHSMLVLNKEMLRACRANNIPSNYLKLLFRYLVKIRGILF